MRASILTSLLAAGSAYAFSDSSPFLLFSTSELSVDQPTSQLQTSGRVFATAKSLLADCPTNNYLLVSQPNVHASDLNSPPSCVAHRLQRALASSQVRGRFTVSEVFSFADETSDDSSNSTLTLDSFAMHIKRSCGSKGTEHATINELALPALPSALACLDRAEAMADNDYVVGNMLDDELAKGDITVVFFSSGAGAVPIAAATQGKSEATSDDPSQIPIKRRSPGLHVPALHHNPQRQDPEKDNRPLFEKYQFFTPGVFMSLLVFFILLSILYVGLSAVASLQVPYGAFDKEMGPAAQKKQQ